MFDSINIIEDCILSIQKAIEKPCTSKFEVKRQCERALGVVNKIKEENIQKGENI